MPRTVIRFTWEQMQYIASAPAEMNTAEVARAIGREYWAVRMARRRVQRDGWLCKVIYVPCVVCGRDICSPALPNVRRVHTFCRAARVAHLARELRRRPHTPSTTYVARWRQENPDDNHRQREIEKAKAAEERATWTREQWAPLLDKVHAADRRDQEISLEAADNSGEVWTADDDLYVWEHMGTPAREIGLALGRTLWAVRGRRVRLRRHSEAAQREERRA